MTIEPKTPDRALTAWIGAVAFAIIFTVIIMLTGSDLIRFTSTFLPPQGARWYPWQLPTRDTIGMTVVWGL